MGEEEKVLCRKMSKAQAPAGGWAPATTTAWESLGLYWAYVGIMEQLNRKYCLGFRVGVMLR